MTEANAKLGFGRQLAIEIFIVLAIGCVLGLIGPFGSYALPVLWRLAYWMGFGLIGYALFRPLNIVAEWAARISGIPTIVAVSLSGLVAGVPMTVMIGFFIGGLRWDSPYLANGFALLYAQICGMGLAIYGVSHLIFARQYENSAEPQPVRKPTARQSATLSAGISDTDLHSQLPAGFPAILAMSVEDHYVKVHGDGRAEMLLMPLGEAIAAMPNGSGLQTHRSWWVAKNAVSRAKRQGRNWRLHLHGSIEAPVSRQNVAAVRAAGLLET